MKLILVEPESDRLLTWVDGLDRIVTSEVAAVEVPLAARRVLGPPGIHAARVLFGTLELVPLLPEIRRAAAESEPATLTALGAIHLASAVSVGSVIDHVLSYDRALASAALAAGLAVEAPGAAA